jgi:thioredoxin reductase (NADPH)
VATPPVEPKLSQRPYSPKLVEEEDTSNDFIVVLEGEVEVIDNFAGEARTMGVFRAGRFLGELNMLTHQAMYLSAVVREGGEVLEIPRERLKEVVTEEQNLSDTRSRSHSAVPLTKARSCLAPST